MTNTEPTTRQPENDSRTYVNPSTAEGWSRLGLFFGMGFFAIGNLLEMVAVVWGGTVMIAGAFTLNTAGKLAHYWSLSIPRAEQVKLSASWILLALTVVGLLLNYSYARYGPGEASFFWSFAVAGLGFGLLHMAAQSKYLPVTEKTADE
ncbi:MULTISPECIES: hypothetical protein [Halorussus]|uniref:Uncharacterized protein n=2 Tax=Halorussus TaxID=1070314 RepID=A0A8U0I2U5_9EURY|nr:MULTISPECIES: hypothetical protein [Halorussus]UPV77181.1 hypothetical protein M0R89_22680 [Halorussus limi]